MEACPWMGFKLHCCPRNELTRETDRGGRGPRSILTSPQLHMEQWGRLCRGLGAGGGRSDNRCVGRSARRAPQTQMQPPCGGPKGDCFYSLKFCDVGRGILHHRTAGLYGRGNNHVSSLEPVSTPAELEELPPE